MKEHNNLERIASLLLLFHENHNIISKKQIFTKLKSFYFSSEDKSENIHTANRKFGRDKKTLEELGYKLISIGKDQYQLSDGRHLQEKNNNYLSDREKKILSEQILNNFSKNPVGYLVLFLKIFYNDYEYLKKLFYITSKKKVKSILTEQEKGILNDSNRFALLLFKKKPLRILYNKKNSQEMIQRNIFPLMLFFNKNISYLVSWDYEKQDIRNYIINNISNVEIIKDKKFKIVKINKIKLRIHEDRRFITIPYEFILNKLPHPLNIFTSNDAENYTINLAIKKEYLDLYKNFIKIENKKILNFKKIGLDTNKIIIQLKIKNLTGLFYFICQYPDSIINMEPNEVKEEFKNFLKDIINFYSHRYSNGIPI